MNIADWIILFILLFAVAAAAVVFVIFNDHEYRRYLENEKRKRM